MSRSGASGWTSGKQAPPIVKSQPAEMNSASSAALPRPPSGWTKSSSPRGGSPRSAKTFSIPASAIRSSVSERPSLVSPTQLRCAIVSSPTSSLSALVISTVPSRVEPPAP